MKVDFYHCTRTKPADVVPALAEKALAAGHRILVHEPDASARDALDERLWTYDPDSFLPHGTAGGPHDAEQPLLIADSFGVRNGADVLIAMGRTLPGDGAGFARILYLFDGGDEEELGAARAHWRALSAREGAEAAYWAQGERGWAKRG